MYIHTYMYRYIYIQTQTHSHVFIYLVSLRMSKEQQKAEKLDLRRSLKAKGALGKRKTVRNADRLKTKPLPMVWDKLRRQKKKEMDRHYSKHVARKQFRGHFHKTKKK